MPIRGENVGTAYVKILADGSGLGDSIKDDLDDTDDIFEPKGKKDAKNYSKGVNTELKRRRPATQKQIDEMFSLHADRAQRITREMGSTYFKNIEKNVVQRYGQEIGERLNQEVRRGFIKNRGDYSQWGQGFESLFTFLDETAERVYADMAARERNFTRTVVRESGRRVRGTSRFADSLDRISIRVGRTFGRGSRNDLVNFFGGITEGMTRTLFLVPKLGAKLLAFSKVAGEMGKELFNVARQSESFASALKNVASGIGTSLSSAASAGLPGLIALGVAVVALTFSLGVLTSIISGLVAALTAMAGTLVLGVVGALGAVAGAVLPVVAGIGLLVVGIASLDKATKTALKDSVKPMIAEFRRLGRIGAEHMFARSAKQAKALSKALQDPSIEKLVAGIGDAIADIGDGWIKALNSTGFKRFNAVMAKQLPDQLRLLGKITSNLFGGLGGLFISLQPLVNRFLGWFERITAEFSKWANSAEGQRSLTNFFQEAGDAAAALGDVIGSLTTALGNLFLAGNDTGSTIFRDIADQLDRFSKFIKDNPESVGDWFSHGLDTIRSVGDAVKSIADLIKALDTPENRKLAVAVFKAMGVAIEAVATSFSNLESLFRGVFGALGDIAKPFIFALATIIDGLAHIPGVSDSLHGVADGLRDAARQLSSINDPKGKWFAGPIKGGQDLTTVLTGLTDPNWKVNVTDDGSMNSLQTLAQLVSDTINGIPKNPKVNATDKGTLDPIYKLSKKTAEQLFDIDGTFNSKVKGTITPSNFAAQLAGIGASIGGLVGTHIAKVVGKTAKSMAGRIASSPMLSTLAEDGKKEAVVPLERPLALVDPAVRPLAAFAQGKLEATAEGGRSVVVGDVTIITPTEDPVAVAEEVMADITGKIL